jgi:hypothetical protein
MGGPQPSSAFELVYECAVKISRAGNAGQRPDSGMVDF